MNDDMKSDNRLLKPIGMLKVTPENLKIFNEDCDRILKGIRKMHDISISIYICGKIANARLIQFLKEELHVNPLNNEFTTNSGAKFENVMFNAQVLGFNSKVEMTCQTISDAKQWELIDSVILAMKRIEVDKIADLSTAKKSICFKMDDSFVYEKELDVVKPSPPAKQNRMAWILAGFAFAMLACAFKSWFTLHSTAWIMDLILAFISGVGVFVLFDNDEENEE